MAALTHPSHFPGSAILHWDRLLEPSPTPTPASGLILTADTLMVQPTQTKFTFIWSAPNMIPLDPRSVLNILQRLEEVPFSQASGTWPNRFIRENAKGVFRRSVTEHLKAMGWEVEGGKLVPIAV